MSPLQSALLAVAVVALAGAAALNLSGRYADWEPVQPHTATPDLADYADRTRAWLALQSGNDAPPDVFRYATWRQLGVEGAVGSRLVTPAGCFQLRAEARFVWIDVANRCDAQWHTAVQVFSASPDGAEINRRRPDGGLTGWRALTDADRAG